MNLCARATNLDGGLFCFLRIGKQLITVLALCAIGLLAQDHPANVWPSTAQAATRNTTLTTSQFEELKAKAESGDADAQTSLGHAYHAGNGVPANEVLAAQWIRKAADQGFASAENNLGTMYRLGEGVNRDKEEAVRWYEKAARHGSPEGMFNLGTCYYNGDGVGSNEFTAYDWFLLAEDAGNPVAKDAVERSATAMSKHDTSSAYLQIAEMYQKGEQLPKNETQTMRWLRRAADTDSHGKAQLAVHLLTGPEASRNYAEALDLCKSAAKDYAPALPCVGFIYRKGLGVPKDTVEALKWYQKGAAESDTLCMMVLADMETAGEGTKVDRASALIWLFRASQMRTNGAAAKAKDLLSQLTPSEMKEVENKLRQMRYEPKKVFDALRAIPAPTNP